MGGQLGAPEKSFPDPNKRPEETVLWASGHGCICMWHLEPYCHLERVKENPLKQV